MSRSASAAPRSPATVVKRANISVFLPTFEKIAARVYFVMSWVTVKVPKAPEPLACMRRSGMTSRTKLASFSLSHTSCDSSGPCGPAVRLFWLSGTGAPNWVVRWVGLGLSDGLLMALAPDVVANAQPCPVAWKGEIERSERNDSCGVLGSFSPEIGRSEEHTSELQALMRSSYAVLCLTKKRN